MEGWFNLASEITPAEIDVYAFDFIAEHGGDLSELCLGRLLEHLTPDDAVSLLRLISARVSAVTSLTAFATDIRSVSEAMLKGVIDVDRFNRSLVHNDGHGSRQAWSYDGETLIALFHQAGFTDADRADPAQASEARFTPPDLPRWLLAVSASVPATGRAERPAHDVSRRPRRAPAPPQKASAGSAEAMLLEQLSVVRAELHRVRAREQEALSKAGAAERLAAELRDARRALDDIQGSTTYRVARRGSLLARGLLPAGSQRRRAAARLLQALKGRAPSAG